VELVQGISRWYTLTALEEQHKIAVVTMDVVQFGDKAWVMNIMEGEGGKFAEHFGTFCEQLIDRGVVVASGYMQALLARSAVRLAHQCGYQAGVAHRTYVPHDDRQVLWVDVWLQDPKEVWQ